MSIIEKAVGKHDRSQGDAGASPVAAPPQNPVEPIPVKVIQNDVRSFEKRTSREFEINLARLHQLGMVTPDGGRTPVSEEFRLIKRPLIENAFGQDVKFSNHRNLIMVTSALPGEGKTFCAINLAMSLAMERDHTVMLVDADVARPSMLRFLGLPESSPGLMDVLHDEVELSSVMLKTNVDSLSLLPTGQSHRHATELLASQTMSKLLDDIANRYQDRLVIFDSPPILLTTEARVLASQMGQIVLVVEAESTTQHAVKDAIRHLGPNANVSLVYNKSRAFADGGYSGRYYR